MPFFSRLLSPLDAAASLPTDKLSARDWGAKAPPSAWEAWLAIAIFPRESPVRWAKAHLYRGAMKPGRHAVSEVEGMDGAGEVLLLAGTKESAAVARRALGEVSVSDDGGFSLREAGGFHLSGAWPSYAVGATSGDPAVAMDLRADASAAMWWVRARGALSYFSALSTVVGTVGGAPTLRAAPLRGAGMFEHAWGRALPFRPSKLMRGWWHWDALAFEGGGMSAGLAVAALPGKALPIRGGGAPPGEPFSRTGGLRVSYKETDEHAAPDGGKIAMPLRWEGEIRGPRGVLTYEARRAGPPAMVIPAGGFYAFDFEGDWRPAGGARTPVRGAGYAESAGAARAR